MRYDLVIFDVDGTLLDTREGIVSSVKYAARERGLPEMESGEIERIFIGPPIGRGFGNAYGLEGEELKSAVAAFRFRYTQHDLLRARPYDGIFGVCRFLKDSGVKIAVATYKTHDYAVTLLRHFGFGEYTDNIHGADPSGKLTKADIIEQCIAESGCGDRSKVLMVGDGINDAEGAKNARIDFLGVTYGYGFSSSEEYPFAVAKRPEEISEYLKKQERLI